MTTNSRRVGSIPRARVLGEQGGVVPGVRMRLPQHSTSEKKFAGLGVSELRERKQRKGENRKLEQLVADLSLDKSILQEALRGSARAGADGGRVGKRFVPSEREEGVPGCRGEPFERTVPERAPES